MNRILILILVSSYGCEVSYGLRVHYPPEPPPRPRATECRDNWFDKCTSNGHCCSNFCDKASSSKFGICKPTVTKCSIPGICSHICEVVKEGFKCQCLLGYHKDPENINRCKADEGNAALLIADVYDIRKVSLERPESLRIVNNTIDATGLDFDFKSGTIFWTDIEEQKIYKASINDGNNVTVVIKSGLTEPFGLAVDWAYNRIYWTDQGKKTIELANFEGTMRKILFKDKLDRPRAIALDAVHGWMYWTDWGSEPKIERAGMDGSSREIIISKEMQRPSGLTIDLALKRLYWTDAGLHVISSCNYDGSGRRVVLYSQEYLSRPFSISTFEDSLYWTDRKQKAVYKADKFTGKGLVALKSMKKTDTNLDPRTIHVYHSYRQPEGPDHCQTIGKFCSHFCLPAPHGNPHAPVTSQCACPEGYKLMSDGFKCVPETESEIDPQSTRLTKCSEDGFSGCITNSNCCSNFCDKESNSKFGVCKQSNADFNVNDQDIRKLFVDIKRSLSILLGESNVKPNAIRPYNPMKDDQDCRTDGFYGCAENRHCCSGFCSKQNGQHFGLCQPDIDECEIPGICSQICQNEKGGFSCQCIDGYYIDPKNFTRCKAEGKAYLLVSQKRSIRSISLDSHNMVEIVDDTEDALALDFDTKSGMIFWNDFDGKKIYKAPIDQGNNATVVIGNGLNDVYSLAVDWIYNHIYWGDTSKNTIELSDFDGKMRKTLISDYLEEPRAIALDPVKGWMYWTDGGNNPKIERAGMDGSYRHTIVSENIKWPNSLAIDFLFRKIYWTDPGLHAISSCNYDGSGRWIVLNSPELLSLPFAITTFEDWVYWSDWNLKAVYKADKVTGKSVSAVLSPPQRLDPMGIQVYHPYRQPYGMNHCNGECSHLCLPAPQVNSSFSKISCACPDGLYLMSNGRGCQRDGFSSSPINKFDQPKKEFPKLPQQFPSFEQPTLEHPKLQYPKKEYPKLERPTQEYPKLQFPTQQYPQRPTEIPKPMHATEPPKLARPTEAPPTKGTGLPVNPDCSLISGNRGKKGIHCLDIEDDPNNLQNVTRKKKDLHGSLLISQRTNIKNISLDFDEVEEVVNGTTDAMTLDFVFKTGMIFWNDYGEKKIYKAPINHKSNRTVVIEEGLPEPHGLAVDWIYNLIYWTDAGENTVEVSDFDGIIRKVLINEDLENPSSLALNPAEGWMYWTDWGNQPKVERAGMDGTHRQVIVSSDIKWPNTLALDLNTSKIYWTDAALHAMFSCNYDGSSRRTVLQSKEYIGLPYAMTTFEDWVYWTDTVLKAVYRVDKASGKIDTVMSPPLTPSATGIQVYHQYRQPVGENYCQTAKDKCSHLCLPAPQIFPSFPKITCACPDWLTLAADNRTCENPPDDAAYFGS